MTDLANTADRAQSKLPDRQSELRVLLDTLMAKTELEDQEEKKVLTRDEEDIGEGSVRGTVCVLSVWLAYRRSAAQYLLCRLDGTIILFAQFSFNLYGVQVMRRKGNLGALSGADGSRYMEYDSKPPKKHPLFKARYVKL